MHHDSPTTRLNTTTPVAWILAALLALFSTGSSAQESEIDASDPTKIYTYAGGGIKYTDYTNNESMIELRATGNFALSDNDMMMFEIGYGNNTADAIPGSSSDVTNGRLRWFHLFPMDDSITSGYRGWGIQVDLQIAGSLKGTDGQNVLAVGVLPAFGINDNWSFYLPLNVVSTWDKAFELHNGYGVGVAPLFVYSPNDWWDGSFLQIWPNYTWFLTGALKDSGAGSIDVVLGGSITATTTWSATYQKNVDEDLRSFRRGVDTGLTGDWNVFFSISRYF